MSVEIKVGGDKSPFSDENRRPDRCSAALGPIRGEDVVWPEYDLAPCPIRFFLDLLAGKWRLPIICSLMEAQTLRWGELKRRLSGITNTMLSGALAELQAAGLVRRTQYNEMPLRVEYSLTETGHDLAPILRRLGEWGLEALLKNEVETPTVSEAQAAVG